MRVLIACEFSATVRNAFAAKGHEAWSCDLLPCEDEAGFHYQGDIFRMLREDPFFDLMIAHPPCTYLAGSGLHWTQRGKRPLQATLDALEFVEKLCDVQIRRICIENPIGFLSRALRVPDQIIQPWMFGHGEVKATCLWLKNLPKLKPTNIVDGRTPRVHHASPGPERWKERSRTLIGIAEAMAAQWGCNEQRVAA